MSVGVSEVQHHGLQLLTCVLLGPLVISKHFLKYLCNLVLRGKQLKLLLDSLARLVIFLAVAADGESKLR